MDLSHSTTANDMAISEQESRERAVGITTFVRSEAPGCHCIIKQRYTDFLVNEILPNGKVLHLEANTSGHKEKKKRAHDREPEALQTAKKLRTEPSPSDADVSSLSNNEPVKHDKNLGSQSDHQPSPPNARLVDNEGLSSISNEDKDTLQTILGEKTTVALLSLYESVIKNPERPSRGHSAVESEPIAEKSKRTEAHVCIRRIFNSKLQSTTVQDHAQQSGSGLSIVIKAASSTPSNRNGESRDGGGLRGKLAWDDLGGDYLHFTLYKVNKDTMEVLYFLASQLRMHIKHFSFAGTKDRKGVTVQRVAIRRMREDQMKNLNRLARGWRLGGPWEYRKEGLQLGMLRGNEFFLTLRKVKFHGEQPGWGTEERLQYAKAAAQTAAETLTKHGFINYYGLQRFGTHIEGTHTVGMKMLQGDLKGAVMAILAYDSSIVQSELAAENDTDGPVQGNKKIPQDDISRATAIDAFIRNGSTVEAFAKLLNGRFQAEKNIMIYLGKRDHKTGRKPNESDYQGALMQVQRNLRLMYVHAYQSYVWNTVAGKRLELFGDQVVEGDLVIVGEKEREEGITSGPSKSSPDVDENGEPIILPSASITIEAEGFGNNDNVGIVSDDPFVRARALSEDEAKSGRFTIFDLVLPLPGFDVVYPQNAVGEFYNEFMGSEAGGALDPHNMRRGWRDISLSGSYRKIMARPLGDGVSAEVRSYTAEDAQLVETDLERIEGKMSSAIEDLKDGPENQEPNDKIAVLLKFQLSSSQYATMALRELTKSGAVAFIPDYSVSHR